MAYLGVMRMNEGRYEDSERLLRRALVMTPDNADLMGLLSTALCSLKRYEESLDLARKSTEMDPENAAAWNELAVVLHIMGDLAGGEKAARRSLGIDPKNADHWVTLGLNLEKQERLAEAEDAYRTSVRIDPYFAMGHKCLEQLYLKTGRFEDAELAWFPDLGEFAKSLSPEERTRLMDYVKIGEDALRENVERMYLDDESG
jgi:tetratricopeptide (TPR) repeat protein